MLGSTMRDTCSGRRMAWNAQGSAQNILCFSMKRKLQSSEREADRLRIPSVDTRVTILKSFLQNLRNACSPQQQNHKTGMELVVSRRRGLDRARTWTIMGLATSGYSAAICCCRHGERTACGLARYLAVILRSHEVLTRLLNKLGQA